MEAVEGGAAGPGDLAVAAAASAGTMFPDNSTIVRGVAKTTAAAAGASGDGSDGDDDSSDGDDDDDDDSSDDDDDDGSSESDGLDPNNPEFEFSDGDDGDGAGDATKNKNKNKQPPGRRVIPGIIRDGDDSSEWSSSSDEEDVEELDLANMPKWLEDIKNGVKSDFDDDAAHAEPPRTKNELAPDAARRNATSTPRHHPVSSTHHELHAPRFYYTRPPQLSRLCFPTALSLTPPMTRG